MSAESSLMLGAAGTFSWLLTLGTELAFVIVIATAVRRHRPDASPILLGAVIFELLVSSCSYASELILPVFAASALGMPGYLATRAISGTVFAASHAAARLLLLWGIIRLARPVEPLGPR